MGFGIFLRENERVSYFQRAIVGLIDTPGVSKIVLCSGYVSEGTQFSISDELKKTMKRATPGGIREIEIVGGMFRGTYGKVNLAKYRSFINNLRRYCRTVPHRAINDRWHAKVALGIDSKDEPIAGIVGSSNLTRPAYGEGRRDFNHEADVLIWSQYPEVDRYFHRFLKSLTDDTERGGPIVLRLDENFKQIDEKKRLSEIYNMIRENRGEELTGVA